MCVVVCVCIYLCLCAVTNYVWHVLYVYFCPADYVYIYIYILRKYFLTKNPWHWALFPIFRHPSFFSSFHSFSKALTPGCLSFFFIKVPGCLFFVGCADVEYNGTCALCDYMATHTRSITDTHWMTDETPARERSFTHNPSGKPGSELEGWQPCPECPYRLVERGQKAVR